MIDTIFSTVETAFCPLTRSAVQLLPENGILSFLRWPVGCLVTWVVYYIAQVTMMCIYYKGCHGARWAGTWIYQKGLSGCGYTPAPGIPVEDRLYATQTVWTNGAQMARRVYEFETELRQVHVRKVRVVPATLASTRVPEFPELGD